MPLRSLSLSFSIAREARLSGTKAGPIVVSPALLPQEASPSHVPWHPALTTGSIDPAPDLPAAVDLLHLAADLPGPVAGLHRR